jgi:hypothetical protein
MATLTEEIRSAVTVLRSGAAELERFRGDLRALSKTPEQYSNDYQERRMRGTAEKLEMILVGIDAAKNGLVR